MIIITALGNIEVGDEFVPKDPITDLDIDINDDFDEDWD